MRVMMTLLLAVIIAAGPSGCAAMRLSQANSEYMGRQIRTIPDTESYGLKVTWGLIGDAILLLALGLGIPFLIVDAIYIWGWEGGYAARFDRDYPGVR